MKIKFALSLICATALVNLEVAESVALVKQIKLRGEDSGEFAQTSA